MSPTEMISDGKPFLRSNKTTFFLPQDFFSCKKNNCFLLQEIISRNVNFFLTAKKFLVPRQRIFLQYIAKKTLCTRKPFRGCTF